MQADVGCVNKFLAKKVTRQGCAAQSVAYKRTNHATDRAAAPYLQLRFLQFFLYVCDTK